MAERLAKLGFPVDFQAVGADYLSSTNCAKDIVETLVIPPLSVASLPINAVVGAISAIDTRSNPLFRQKRNGMEWQNLEVWKWRTMRGEHSTTQGVVDDRASKVGNLLRTTSLDELPGLVQAALGELALVGPRPRLEIDHERMRRASPDIYEYWATHASAMAIKAGLFSRGANLGHAIGGQSQMLDIQTMLLDIEYLQNASVKEDLMIVASTPKALIKGGRRTIINMREAKKAKKKQLVHNSVDESPSQRAA